MLNIEDNKPKYYSEEYCDDYNTLHYRFIIDIEMNKISNNIVLKYQRNKINPNLKHLKRCEYLNEYHKVLSYKIYDLDGNLIEEGDDK